MAQVVEAQIGHLDLVREVTPGLAIVLLRGPGAVDTGEEQGSGLAAAR